MSINSCLAYDEECMYVLCDKKLLSYLLKLCVKEYENLPLAQIEQYIEVENNETGRILSRGNEIITVMKEKIVLDVLFTSKYPDSERNIDTFINLETQNEYHPKSKDHKSYPLIKRSIYYVGSLLHIQKGPVFENDNYQDLKKVNSLWINTDPPENVKNMIQRYELRERNELKKHYGEKKENYDLINIVMLNLGDEEDGVLGPLNELFVKDNTAEEKYRNLKEKYGIEVSEETRGGIQTMCNLGEGILRKGISQGISKGIDTRTIEFITRIMQSKNFDYAQAARYLELTEKEEKDYQMYFI